MGAERDKVETISLTGAGLSGVAKAHSVFEVLVAEGAEIVGSYGDDFYAGRAAVTRRASAGGGAAWYIGTLLESEGLTAILHAVLTGHGLIGPYSDEPELEFSVREGAGGRISFLLNHADAAVSVRAHASGTDLLTDTAIAAGDSMTIGPKGVVVLREG